MAVAATAIAATTIGRRRSPACSAPLMRAPRASWTALAIGAAVRWVTSDVFGSVLDSCSSMIAPCSRRGGRLQEDVRLTAWCLPAASRKTPGLRPGVVRKVDNDARRGAAHDYPSKRLLHRSADLHVRQEGR